MGRKIIFSIVIILMMLPIFSQAETVQNSSKQKTAIECKTSDCGEAVVSSCEDEPVKTESFATVAMCPDESFIMKIERWYTEFTNWVKSFFE